MGQRALSTKKTLVTPPSSSDDMDTSGSMSDFQILVNALQDRYTKKARDQQVTFETEMKAVVAQTVDMLSSKVTDYEAHLTTQLNTLESELMKIGKERDTQVTTFERQYSSMKKAVETCLTELGELDEKYNATVKDFFASMKSYRDTAAQSRDSIAKLAESSRPKSKAPSAKRRK